MFYFLTYNEDNTFVLKSEKGEIFSGVGSEQLFSIPKKDSFIYDDNLSITKYLVGADKWDECRDGYKDGQTNKLKKGNLTFINSKNVANKLTINKVKTLKKDFKKLPTSQASLVRARLDELIYPDFKCWLNNEAYFKIIQYVMPGGLIGYNPDIIDIELSACQWDIKSCYPSIMYYEKFPTKFLRVADSDDMDVLSIYKWWIANFKITGIEHKKNNCIDWLPRNSANLYSFTSLDYKMFVEDYDFTSIKMQHLIVHQEMELLPETIRNFIKTSMLNKEANKNSKVYEEAKRNSNIIYGCFYTIPQRQDTPNHYRMTMYAERRRPSIIGVWVTSYARYKLWKAINIYPEAVIYWNTDGFITLADISDEIEKMNIYGFKNFGNFELKQNYNDVIVFGNSQVYVNGKLKCAGLSTAGGNRYLKDKNIKPYYGLVIPPEYSGRWAYLNGKLVKQCYTIGGINL